MQAHYQTTATEIWQQTQGRIDYLVAAASSGGTITGVAKYLKAKNPTIKMILPDPIGSIFYSHFHHVDYHKQSYQVEGAGKDRVCTIHDFRYIDDVIQFSDAEAFAAAQKLARTEGMLAGGSAGGALSVAEKVASTWQGNEKPNIVVILADSGFKYLSKLDDGDE